MEKYYFKVHKISRKCLEDCCVAKSSIGNWKIRIGSMACQKCEHNKGHNIDHNSPDSSKTTDGDKDWIMCDVLEQAKGGDQ